MISDKHIAEPLSIDDLTSGNDFELSGFGKARLTSVRDGVYYFLCKTDESAIEELGFLPEQLIPQSEQIIATRGNPGRTKYEKNKMPREYGLVNAELRRVA